MVRVGRMTAVMLMMAAVVVGAPASALAQAKLRVAVMNFENNSTWSWWGDNLGRAGGRRARPRSSVQSGKYTVLERAQLDAILQEQNLGASGAVTAPRPPRWASCSACSWCSRRSITAFSIKRTSIGLRGIGGTYPNAESKVERAWSTPKPAK